MQSDKLSAIALLVITLGDLYSQYLMLAHLKMTKDAASKQLAHSALHCIHSGANGIKYNCTL